SVADAPSFDELAAYVEGRLDREERALLEERLASDPDLRQEVDDLRELHRQMARPRGTVRWLRPLPLAALAAAATVAMVAVVSWRRPPAEVRPPGEMTIAPPAAIASLKDGDRHLTLSADGVVSGVSGLDAGLRGALTAALRGTLPAPQGLAPLQSGPGALMGTESTAATFALRSPLGTRVSADRPTLRWTAQPGARSYEVAVYDQDLRKQLASGPVAGTEWTPATPLARGRTYLWQVSAVTPGGRITAPAPPAPEARFEVASPALMAEVERRRAPAPASHLVAALAFVQAGLLDDAETELQALAASNPGSPEVARLREALRTLRRAG
ncbi:MAG TPA: hypothetical protein VGQ33_05825, partial [Vicinamibacteria bacterium]|nr:hypothetical protein [Vicinamibacteria bacterium]